LASQKVVWRFVFFYTDGQVYVSSKKALSE
jgi:hypothetical protein